MADREFETAYRLQQAGDLDAASRILDGILREAPRHANALYLRGFIAFQRECFVEAERLISQSLAAEPRALDALFTYARVLERLGRLADSLRALDVLLQRDPRIAKAWTFRGILFLQMQRHEHAIAAFEKALALDPGLSGAWTNKGVAETALGRLEDALTSFARNLALRPRDPAAFVRHASALSALMRYDAAAAEFARALMLDPDYPLARGEYTFAKLSCCDWTGYEAERAAIVTGVAAGRRVVQPGICLAIADSPAVPLQCAQIWAANAPAAEPFPPAATYRHERIRVAYLSADFADRVVANVSAGVFEHHDRARFETFAIAFGPDDKSPVRRRLERAFEHFVDVRSESDGAIAERMRAMEIDIAIDIMGYTTECRSGILAHRPAPIQVNWLGFPGTMGVKHIDYILADRVVIPEAHKAFYSENVVWLPGSYLPCDSQRRRGSRIPSRAEAGLPESGFVFASFNNSYKFAPPTFDIWMRLLRAVDGSVLWLPRHGAAVVNFRREAEARGVSPDRLVFATYCARAEDHLARLSLADLFLDTSPYGAHSSAADALRAGVPVVTYAGNTFPGRVAASLLMAMGIPELVASSLTDYEALALKFAHDSVWRASVRERLARESKRSIVFDSAAFARHLESAFEAMVHRHRAGEPPASFAL